MEEEHYQKLIIDYFEKRISDEGFSELTEWIECSSENLDHFREHLQILESSKYYFKEPVLQQKVWDRISRHVLTEESNTNSPVSFKPSYSWLAYAAIILLTSVTSLLFYRNSFKVKESRPVYTEFNNQNGKRSRITLPDSSIVYLNGASKLRYPKAFSGDTREVFLEGEAFFEVVHDKERPFIVQSGKVNTTVLGTSFNVTAFKGDNRVAVTVQSGKVGVSIKREGNRKFLQYLFPDQQLDINTITGDFSFNTLDAANITSWKDDRIVFNNNSLEEIGRTLERWYDVKVVLSNPENSSSRFTAKFDYLPLNQLMEIFAQLSGCTYTIQQNQLIINNKNCK
ncbi:FecR domain-containing protein [Pedobacter sp. P351]|uniref:FecR family protein n=1 Tax=Pedobacter superstes TaxID=3133441 RepID=UPI0030B5FF09